MRDILIGRESRRLMEELVKKGRFTMVKVGNNWDVGKVFWKFQILMS